MANWPVLSGADVAAFAQQNLLQTLKQDIDGQIACTGVQQWKKGADVTAAAGVLTLGNDGNYFDVGVGNISSIVQLAVGGVAVQAGTPIKLHFDAIVLITHHATNLILPGSININTVAGDELEFTKYENGWRCTNTIYPTAYPNEANIQSWGAVGDGITDDTAAILAAYASLPATGGVLVIPYATAFYKMTSVLSIEKPIKIRGHGYNLSGQVLRGSVLKQTGSGIDCLNIGIGVLLDAWSIDDLAIGTTAAGRDAIVLNQAQRGFIKNLFIGGAARYGFRCTGINILNNFDHIIMSMGRVALDDFAIPTVGFKLDASTNANSFICCGAAGIVSAPGYGWQITDNVGNTFVSPEAEGCTIGFRFDGGSNNTFICPYTEANGADVSGSLGVGAENLLLGGPYLRLGSAIGVDVYPHLTSPGLCIQPKLILSETPDIVSSAGAISLITAITHIVSNGVGTVLTLAAGVEGQFKNIILKTLTTPGDTDLITPDGGGAGFTTITLDAVGDAVTLLYSNGKWTIVGLYFNGPIFDHLHLISGQIGFPATQVPSADANTLDDYEEGTWQATVSCGTSGTITAKANSIYYTKTGRMVHVCGRFQIDSISSPVGTVIISGLPFLVLSGLFSAGSFFCEGMETTATNPCGRAYSNTYTIIMQNFAAGVMGNLAESVKADSWIGIDLTYITS